MINCAEKCLKNQSGCTERRCRLWIDYGEDFNCTAVAVNKSPEMTLSEVSKRLNVSIVRVKQIQDAALQKLKKIYDY